MTTQITKQTLTKNRPTILQMIFSLTFLLSLLYFKLMGFLEWTFLYFFLYWIWLTFIAYKTIRHPKTEYFGGTLTNINILLSVFIIIADFFIIILSLSFLFRIILANFYQLIAYGTLCFFIVSVVLHFIIISKNIYTIDKTKSVFTTCIKLLFYPVGIWTIQETLKQNSAEKWREIKATTEKPLLLTGVWQKSGISA